MGGVSVNPIADKKRAQAWRAWDGLLQSPDFDEFLLDRNLNVCARAVPLSHDDGAETALLGALLFGTPDEWATCHSDTIARVRPHHFYWGESATVYIAVGRLYQRQKQGRGGAIDVITVASELRASGLLIDDETSVYNRAGERRFVRLNWLMGLLDGCPNIANIAAYADTVLRCARLRSLHALGALLQDAVVGEMAPQGQHDYCEMGGQPLGSDPAQIANAARRALDAIEERGAVKLRELFKDSK